MAADTLAQQYVDVNAFPGAKKVTIMENEAGSTLPHSLNEVLKQRRSIASKLHPRTPIPTVLDTRNNAERPAVLRTSGGVQPATAYAGDGIDTSLPASPFSNSPAANEAREIAAASSGEQSVANGGQPPAQQPQPAENGGEPPKNESDRSPLSPGQ
jgi:hypothetical protein